MGISSFFDGWDTADPSDLSFVKAQGLVSAVNKSPFARLVECKRSPDTGDIEAIIFDVEPQVGQRPVHDIRLSERLAALFTRGDVNFPEVLSQREDFPSAPHLNIRPQEYPASLCLYEETYDEVRLRWTAERFLETIRWWLALTAKGELHGDDQPLEPLLPQESKHLILAYGDDNEPRGFRLVRHEGGQYVIDDSLHMFQTLYVRGQKQVAGIIQHQPKTLLDLHTFFVRAGLDLLDIIRGVLSERYKNFNKEAKKDLYQVPLVIVAGLPKVRAEKSEPESIEYRAFLIKPDIRTIGKEIGVWDVLGAEVAALTPPDLSKTGDKIEVEVLNYMEAFSPSLAALYNGLQSANTDKYVLIGCGALGSQVLINLIRAGFGEWTVIDDDWLAPHNLARHALPGSCVGMAKADCIAHLANDILNGRDLVKGIVKNVMEKVTVEELTPVYVDAKALIDISTSIPVARHLAHDVCSDARRISVFLNPSGTDSVILAEDEKRDIPLDMLEMQYYRHLLNEVTLSDHLKANEGRIRYARSCRDLSTVMSQDYICLHAGLCSHAIRKTLSSAEAKIAVWHIKDENMQVDCHALPVYKVQQVHYGDWKLSFDDYFIKKIAAAREKSLPNETGGALIGAFDMLRKVIYLVDVILAPRDSVASRVSFIRGKEELPEQFAEITRRTAGRLEYIGEWHSHPDGSATLPSADDKVLFQWMVTIMDDVGLPPVMLIAGEDGEIGIVTVTGTSE